MPAANTPWASAVPLPGPALCVLPAARLAQATWLAFGIRSVVGLAVYVAYGRKRSELAQGE